MISTVLTNQTHSRIITDQMLRYSSHRVYKGLDFPVDSFFLFRQFNLFLCEVMALISIIAWSHGISPRTLAQICILLIPACFPVHRLPNLFQELRRSSFHWLQLQKGVPASRPLFPHTTSTVVSSVSNSH